MDPKRRALGLLVLVGLLQACGGTVELASSSPQPSCTFRAGAFPEQTLAAGAPHGAQIPIDHIIVLMQENRSFDSYFGQLPGVDGFPPDAANPDSNGAAVAAFHQTQYCTADTDHSWTGSHEEFNGSRNDGFVLANNPEGARAMGYYDQSDLPFYYALAANFAISDRYFSSLLGPTYPNRFYLLAGTSYGRIRNDAFSSSTRPQTIFDLLDANGISWKEYYNDLPFSLAIGVSKLRNRAKFAMFLSDAAAGTLPQVAFVEPAFTSLHGPESDEHPPSNIQVGQQFVAGVVQALLDSPSWPRSVMFLTYDEHGGFYDHVPPPAACVPDAVSPQLDSTDPGSDFPAQFDRYGFRVPVVVISPYAKPHFVSHHIYDHTSILRFIEARFDLPALTNRDANAEPMLDLFDFSRPALLNPPTLPPATIDPARQQQCQAGG